MAFTTLKLTPGQLRQTVCLSKETFRHWRQVLPSIRSRTGRSPAFSPGDAVALSVLRILTDDWGLQIGHLCEVSTQIFRLCNATPWVALEGETLLIDVANNDCKLLRTAAGLKVNKTVLLCPLTDVMHQLREHFLRTEPPSLQTELRLAPTAIRKQRAGRRA